MRRTVLVAMMMGLAAAVNACGSAPRQAGGEGPSRDRDVLTAAELASAPVSNAYDAVQRLRPEFLRSRGLMSLENASSPLPVVYLDNVAAGGPEMLRSIRVADVYEIRFYSAADATTRYGTGHAAGVIAVTTRRGRTAGRR